MDIHWMPKSKEVEHLVPRPKPAKEYLPEWMKKMPAFEDGNKPSFWGSPPAKTAKLCMPFTDTFQMGYIQETWNDIAIEIDESGETMVTWPSVPVPVNVREKEAFKIPDEYHPFEYAWQTPWIPKLPKGYSMMITHPLNRVDLPFISLAGIVEYDSFIHEDAGEHPFFVRKSFTGVIPKGTPMYQLIPFKRDEWKSIQDKYDEMTRYRAEEAKTKFWGWYKKEHWVKKKFQ